LIWRKQAKGPKITDSVEGSSYLNFWRTCWYSFNQLSWVTTKWILKFRRKKTKLRGSKKIPI
jgi:hypothetical protein